MGETADRELSDSAYIRCVDMLPYEETCSKPDPQLPVVKSNTSLFRERRMTDRTDRILPGGEHLHILVVPTADTPTECSVLCWPSPGHHMLLMALLVARAIHPAHIRVRDGVEPKDSVNL